MSTKLYLTNKTSEYLDSITRGGWDHFTAVTRNLLIDTNKIGNQSGVVQDSFTGPPEIGNPNRWLAGTYRGITRKLVPQTISGTFDIFTFIMQNNAVAVYSRIHVYILDTTGGDNTGTVFATLINKYEDYPTGITWSIVSSTLAKLGAPVTITPVTIPNDGRDYRLVVEMGGFAVVTPFTSGFLISQEVGARKADLTPLDDINTSGGATYFEFSSTILLKDAVTPINSEVENAIDLPAPPTAIVVDPVHVESLWYKMWISFDGVIASLACSSTGRATVSLYTQETTGFKFWITSELNGLINFPVQLGKFIYFKTQPEVETAAPYSLSIEFYDSSLPAQSGDVILTTIDENLNLYDPTVHGLYPTMIRSTGGPIRTLSGKFTSSKLAVALYAGRFGMVNQFTRELFIYGRAPTFQLLARVPGQHTSVSAIGTNLISFYVLGRNPAWAAGENKLVVRFDQNGIYHNELWILPIAEVTSLMGVSRDSVSILYYGQTIANGQLHRFNLNTSQPMSSFGGPTFPGVDSYWPQYVIVMSDNTICCHFRAVPATGPNNQDIIIHYAPDGTILHIRMLSSLPTDAVVQYICHAIDDDPDRIWIRYAYSTPAVDKFLQLRISDGITASQIGGDLYMLSAGKGPANQPCSHKIWGSQLQGAMVMMMNVPDVSGVYILNSANKHDIYYKGIEVKIPDPTIRTAFIGE